jgi:uncharacterized membrane protein
VTTAADVFRWLLGGVCGQIEAHSFVAHGEALPLCARCSGTYVGAMVGLLVWRLGRRSRSGAFPPTSVIALLAAFIGAWALDGFNSFLSLIPEAPYLYAPSNTLRMVTGMLNGLAIATVVHPLFNLVAWNEPIRLPATEGLRSLVFPLAILTALAGAALLDLAGVHYGLLIVAIAGLLTTLTLVNAAGVVVLLRREKQAERWPDLVLPLLVGFLCTLTEISALALLMGWIRSGGLRANILG